MALTEHGGIRTHRSLSDNKSATGHLPKDQRFMKEELAKNLPISPL